MFRRTDSFTVRTQTGEEVQVEEHTHFHGNTPGLKQYRTRTGASVTRKSEHEFEIAGIQGPVKAVRIESEIEDEASFEINEEN